MPYLSRIWVNPLRQGAQKLLGNRQAMHAAVLGGIPVQPVTERVLWRLDTDCVQRPALLVLSQSKPSWEHMVEQAGWPGADAPQAEVRDYASLLRRLSVGETFAFRLTANPVQSTKSPDKLTAAQAAAQKRDPRRSFRVGHRTVEHQMSWLLRRAPSWGVRILPARTDATSTGEDGRPLDVRISARQRLSFARKGGQRVTLQVVTYEGHVAVEELAPLQDVLISGVGKAKAYGCGLLTLAPSMQVR